MSFTPWSLSYLNNGSMQHDMVCGMMMMSNRYTNMKWLVEAAVGLFSAD
jgi:hypothetical protein